MKIKGWSYEDLKDAFEKQELTPSVNTSLTSFESLLLYLNNETNNGRSVDEIIVSSKVYNELLNSLSATRNFTNKGHSVSFEGLSIYHLGGCTKVKA